MKMKTKKDGRVKCPFYMNFGACRHGDDCVRIHPTITTSPTLLLSHIYSPPTNNQDYFEEFYKNLYAKLREYGEIKGLIVCDNQSSHLVGNAYVKYQTEKHASIALDNLRGTSFAGRPIVVEFSPVKHFRKNACAAYERDNVCLHDPYCNFFHIKKTCRFFLMHNKERNLAADGGRREVGCHSLLGHGSDQDSSLTY